MNRSSPKSPSFPTGEQCWYTQFWFPSRFGSLPSRRLHRLRPAGNPVPELRREFHRLLRLRS